jgi:hypothetical protein
MDIASARWPRQGAGPGFPNLTGEQSRLEIADAPLDNVTHSRDGNGDPILDSPRGIPLLGDGDGEISSPTGM